MPACISVCHLHTRCPWRPEKSIKSQEMELTDGCELSRGCWDSNLGPLEKQPALFIAEPSFQSPNLNYFNKFSASHFILLLKKEKKRKERKDKQGIFTQTYAGFRTRLWQKQEIKMFQSPHREKWLRWWDLRDNSDKPGGPTKAPRPVQLTVCAPSPPTPKVWQGVDTGHGKWGQ